MNGFTNPAKWASFLLILALFLSGRVHGDEISPEDRNFFESKIRPVLVKHCYECHSAESKELGGKLSLDNQAGMLKGGESGASLIPGKPEESLLVQSLRYASLEMPPTAPLPEATINDFVEWIKRGAPDPRVGHETQDLLAAYDPESLWSFHPRQSPHIPAVQQSDWPRDPIDHFILSRIEHEQLSPTSDASPRTLVRRLYFDLIGLPPTAEQVDAFVSAYQQSGQQAIENLVDELLARPQFGERWGRHWLDVARYGESNGNDGLGRNATFPHAWRYRDYVIDSFNRDLPYDRFLIEQIAGDLLPASSAEERNRQLVATGFLAIGSKPAAAMNTNFAMDIVDDQINAVCTSILGLSVACARCHDHKHDPIPTRDYYAMAGIFSSTETLYGAAANEKLTAPPTELHQLQSAYNPAAATSDRSRLTLPEDYSASIDQLQPLLHFTLDSAPAELHPLPEKVSFSKDEFAKLDATTISGKLPSAEPSYSVSFWFKNDTPNDKRVITAYLFSRAELGNKSLPGDHIGIGGTHDKSRTGKLFVFNGNDPKTKKSVAGTSTVQPGTWNHLVFVREKNRVKLFLNGGDIPEVDTEITATFGESLDYCLANRSDNFTPLEGNLAEFAFFPRALTDAEAILLHTASGQPKQAQSIGVAMGVREKEQPADCKIHINGEGKTLGEVIPRGFLTAFGQVPAPTKSKAFAPEISVSADASGRMELAQWLTHPDHPLTSRVIANRVWLSLFGQGIVSTPDDFGVYGARPTHPELLDHLAERFIQDGWSTKRFIRTLVLTRTYQLDSWSDSKLREADPDNKLFARHPRRRLDAESLRDAILQASGELDLNPGQGSAVDELDILLKSANEQEIDLHPPSSHRSVYLCMLRHSPPPELAAFDLPDGVTVTGQRNVTTLPSQSLFLLNSPFVIEQSELLADHILKRPDLTDSERIQFIFRQILSRNPDAQEIQQVQQYLQSMTLALSSTAADARRASWASLCQSLLTTNEFRYLD